MVKFKHMKASVAVEGHKLQEYDDPDEEVDPQSRTVTKYIEAAAGKAFIIRFSLLLKDGFDFAGADFVSWDIHLDGLGTTSTAIRRDKTTNPPGQKRFKDKKSGAMSGSGNKWIKRDFVFANIELCTFSKVPFLFLELTYHAGDQPQHMDPSDLKKKYENIGKIEIKVWRWTGHRRSKKKGSHSVSDKAGVGGKVPEKAVKGQAISVTAGYAIFLHSMDHRANSGLA